MQWKDAFWKNDMTENQWGSLSIKQQFAERLVYDENGNILKYRRHAQKTDYVMDRMSYVYNTGIGNYL